MDLDSSREEEESAADCSKELKPINTSIWIKWTRKQIRILKSDGRVRGGKGGRIPPYIGPYSAIV